MKLCRFDGGKLGLVRGDRVLDVTEAVTGAAAPTGDECVRAWDLAVRRAITEAAAAAPSRHLSEVRLLPPVARPGKIVAAPVNYVAHLDEVRASDALHHGVRIDEIRRAGLFLKAASALIGPADPVRMRFPDRRTDHEVELVAVIGRAADRVSPDDALDHVAGYCVGLDITLRGPEDRSFRKSIDTYAVLGPWMVTADEFGAPTAAGLKLSVNGEPRQAANTRDLIMPVADLVAWASEFYTLQPGDLLFTGTPEGVGPIRPGDTIAAGIDGIGEMSVQVEAA